MRALVAGALLLASACVARHQRPPEPTTGEQFTIVVTQARTAAARGQRQQADDLLRVFIDAHPESAEAREARYWRAILRLEGATSKADREARRHLDTYLADTVVTLHGSEARVIRNLLGATDSLMFLRDSVTGSARQAATAREDELKKEIQALKEQLDKTNEELTRIKRRLGGRP
jgi:hypothetical protein